MPPHIEDCDQFPLEASPLAESIADLVEHLVEEESPATDGEAVDGAEQEGVLPEAPEGNPDIQGEGYEEEPCALSAEDWSIYDQLEVELNMREGSLGVQEHMDVHGELQGVQSPELADAHTESIVEPDEE